MKEWTKEEIDSVCELVGGNVEEFIRQLHSRLESLEKDAARYRWLSKEKLHIVPAGMDGPEFPRLVFGFDFHCRTPELHNEEGLSKAIDTAMQSAKGAE